MSGVIHTAVMIIDDDLALSAVGATMTKPAAAESIESSSTALGRHQASTHVLWATCTSSTGVALFQHSPC